MSRRAALIFPGQGAQHVGMGVDFADRYERAAAVFAEASDVLEIDLLTLCREGPLKALVRTDIQQPAILAAGAATVEAMREAGALSDDDTVVCFGLSLGEFTALWAAGALSLRDALTLVRERGIGMQEASEATPSGLLALRCEREQAETVCTAVREETGGVCGVANLNAPGQVVISGDAPSLEAAERIATDEGIRRPRRLQVAGAFHSSLMAPGAKRLEAALDHVTVETPRVPVISNVTAEASTDANVLRANVIRQVTSPVLFMDCVRHAASMKVATMIESAPGRVLSALVRRILDDMPVTNVSSTEALDEFINNQSERSAQ